MKYYRNRNKCDKFDKLKFDKFFYKTFDIYSNITKNRIIYR